MYIIAFGGVARAGKTTAASAASEVVFEMGMTPRMMSFAQDLKAAAARIGLTKDGNPDKYRKTLQRWGESRRAKDQDFWVKRTEKRLLAAAVKEKNLYAKLGSGWSEEVLLFDDLRYPNEVDLISRWGGITVFIDGARRLKDMKADYRKHESEALAMNITYDVENEVIMDYHIRNEKDEAAFRKSVKTACSLWVDSLVLRQ